LIKGAISSARSVAIGAVKFGKGEGRKYQKYQNTTNRIIAIAIKERNLQNGMLIKVIYFSTEFLKLFENVGFTTTHTDTDTDSWCTCNVFTKPESIDAF